MTFANYENSEQIDQAQAQVGADGKRTFETDHKFRAHLESERVRIAEGRPVPKPEKPSTAGMSFTGPNGQRAFAEGGVPDPRVLQLCEALAARKGPDGRRLSDTSDEWRASVDASFADALKGARWSAEAESILQSLKSEAAAQAEDSGLYRGSEKQSDFTFDRTDSMFQSAAATASEAGLDDKQFGKMLAWFAKQQGTGT